MRDLPVKTSLYYAGKEKFLLSIIIKVFPFFEQYLLPRSCFQHLISHVSFDDVYWPYGC